MKAIQFLAEWCGNGTMVLGLDDDILSSLLANRFHTLSQVQVQIRCLTLNQARRNGRLSLLSVAPERHRHSRGPGKEGQGRHRVSGMMDLEVVDLVGEGSAEDWDLPRACLCDHSKCCMWLMLSMVTCR